MSSVGHMQVHSGARSQASDSYPIRQFWIAFALAVMTAFGVASLALASVLVALSLAG